MRTTFDEAVCNTPSPEGNHTGTRGGMDIKDGRKETPGTIPNQPTISSYEGDENPGFKSIEEFMTNRTWPASKGEK